MDCADQLTQLVIGSALTLLAWFGTLALLYVTKKFFELMDD